MKKFYSLICMGIVWMLSGYAQEPMPSITVECADPGSLISVELPADTWSFDHVFIKGRFSTDDLEVVKNALDGKNINVLNCKDAYFLKGGSQSAWENSVGVIEDGTFPRCFLGAHTIVMPKTLKRVIAWQGTECRRLMLPDGLERIEQYAFEWGGVDSLVNMPESIKYIGAGAFYSVSLHTLKMPDDIKIIEDTCLYVSKKLHLPANLEEISWCGVGFGGESLTLPAKLRRIGPVGLTARKLKELHVLAEEPPFCDNELNAGELYNTYAKYMGPSLDGIDKSVCVLFVPKGTIEKYRAAHEWGEFVDIREEADDYVEDMTGFREWENVEKEYSDNASVNGVAIGNEEGLPSYYDIQGRKTDKPASGINIVVYPDGTTKKVMVE